MALNSAQLAILEQHANAGDRVAYYEALAGFGDNYGNLALGVTLNNSLSGAAANKYFLDTAGDESQVVSNNELARVRLELMLADNKRQGDLQRHALSAYHDI